MEVISQQQESNGHLTRGCHWLKALPNKFCAKVIEIARMTKKLGQDDPRRIIHSLKVGLALTLVSLIYSKPLYDGFGESAMWAVLTVVVVFEFSVGATLGKGLNRMLATFVAGGLGVGAHCLATLSGVRGEPILIANFVFIIATIVTFMRFFPRMKARYDYGLSIFILTFCLVSVSGYRNDQVLKIAHERLSTIIIGSCTSVIVCICVWPVWIGQDLHNSVAVNMEKLGKFLEAFGDEYFKVSEEPDQSNENKSYLQGYRSVLTSKSSEETMANFARWEPGHGPFGYRHPWKMYLKIGNLTRECAYKVDALNSYLNSKIQTPAEIRGKIQGPCTKVSLESSRALKELASTFRKMVRTRSVILQIGSSKTAAEELKTLLKTSLWEEADLLEIIPAASVASLLLEIIDCIEKIAEDVNELTKVASFRNSDATVSPGQPDLLHQGTVQVSNTVMPHHVITIAE